MTDPFRKAALFFHDDGFDPVSKELNGRRVAGASFLRGFLQHSGANEVGLVTDNRVQMDRFQKLAKDLGYTGGVRGRVKTAHGLPEGYSVLHLPGPVLTSWAWRRRHQRHADYSLCGVTHTTATSRILNGLVDMRVAPVEEYDGVMMTSKAVQNSIFWLLDEMDEHLADRFQDGVLPARPQMPVIPLGIHTRAFERDANARKIWRSKLGLKAEDCLVITVSRLNSFAKFDPLPMFLALEIAASKSKCKVHFLAVGPYSDAPTTRVFERGAKHLAPSIIYHHVDGTKVEDAHGIWSAGDVFTLPVDNIQETFGLAPVEAMAAGLPVVVSDWDGFRDTIPNDAGFRIKTIGPKPGSTAQEGLRYYLEADSYAQYLAQASFQTVIDVNDLAEAYRILIEDPKKATEMGQKGQKHAQTVYDWSKVIPEYQVFWKELDDIRKHHKSGNRAKAALPVAPDPSQLFEGYASKTAAFSGMAFRAVQQNEANMALEEFFKLREIPNLKRMTVKLEILEAVLNEVKLAKGIRYETLATTTPKETLDRALLWLLKYDFIKIYAA